MKKPVGLSKLLKKIHARKWVAFSRDYRKVVGYDENLASLRKKIGAKDVVYMKVPRTDTLLAF